MCWSCSAAALVEGSRPSIGGVVFSGCNFKCKVILRDWRGGRSRGATLPKKQISFELVMLTETPEVWQWLLQSFHAAIKLPPAGGLSGPAGKKRRLCTRSVALCVAAPDADRNAHAGFLDGNGESAGRRDGRRNPGLRLRLVPGVPVQWRGDREPPHVLLGGRRLLQCRRRWVQAHVWTPYQKVGGSHTVVRGPPGALHGIMGSILKSGKF